MAHIRPFAGVHYARHRDIDFSKVIAPPYDVLDEKGSLVARLSTTCMVLPPCRLSCLGAASGVSVRHAASTGALVGNETLPTFDDLVSMNAPVE